MLPEKLRGVGMGITEINRVKSTSGFIQGYRKAPITKESIAEETEVRNTECCKILKLWTEMMKNLKCLGYEFSLLIKGIKYHHISMRMRFGRFV